MKKLNRSNLESSFIKEGAANAIAAIRDYVRGSWTIDSGIQMRTVDMFHPTFEYAPIAKQELSRQLVKSAIFKMAYAVRREIADDFFNAKSFNPTVTYEPKNGSWMTGGDNVGREHDAGGIDGTAPKYDLDPRDQVVVAQHLLASALDMELVMPTPTWFGDLVNKAGANACDWKSQEMLIKRDSLKAALEGLSEDQIEMLLSSEFDEYRSSFLDLEELVTRMFKYFDIPQRVMKALNPTDILVPKDLCRAQMWAIGDPYADKDKRWGAFFKALKAGEAAQVKLMTGAWDDLQKLESKLFPENEAT